MFTDPASALPSRLRSLGGYVALLAVGVVGFLLVRAFGETLTAPVAAAESPAAAPAAAPPDFFHILLAMAAVIAAGQALGRLFQHLRQPPVIGEVVAGILLGPTLLGRLSPAAYHFLLPESVAPYLEAIAQIGVLLYMFLVGLDLNASLLRKRAHATVAISHASIVCPFSSARCWPCGFTRACPVMTCRSPLSPCSWAWPCRSRPSPCWPASSPTAS